MLDFFKETDKFMEKRKQEIRSWITHHEACITELNRQLDQIDSIPRSYQEIMDKYKKEEK